MRFPLKLQFSGFEASAAETLTRSPKDALRFAQWVVR